MSERVDISGLDKAAVLAALYNRAKPQGMGMLHYDPAPWSAVNALAYGRIDCYHDYVKGRVLKVDLSGDEFSPALYDRDNGTGAAAEAIAPLRQA